jgi:Family of unknown function (DUF6496)
MPRQTPRQRRIMGRVMHEFEHGELKSGPSGKGGKVKSRRQAIAIGLRESGASKYESEKENRRNLAHSKEKESSGETYQQEAEGKSHLGAKGRRESTLAMGGSISLPRVPRPPAPVRVRAERLMTSFTIGRKRKASRGAQRCPNNNSGMHSSIEQGGCNENQ